MLNGREVVRSMVLFYVCVGISADGARLGDARAGHADPREVSKGRLKDVRPGIINSSSLANTSKYTQK